MNFLKELIDYFTGNKNGNRDEKNSKCSRCLNSLKNDESFCFDCGIKKSSANLDFCSRCGNILFSGVNFCSKCGKIAE